jgi:glucitol/sorbitol PTS system EIIC component
MNLIVQFAVWFIGLFQAGATQFTGLVTGIIPLVIVLMTAFNALVALIGQERVDRFAAFASRPGWAYTPLRYLALPVVAVFFLTNPMAYTMGRFLPEKLKPAFYDSAVSFVHPPLGLFPHVNPGELFVWAGIAQGVTTGYGALMTARLAVAYLIVGLIVIFIRGVVTERITLALWKEPVAAEEPAPSPTMEPLPQEASHAIVH